VKGTKEKSGIRRLTSFEKLICDRENFVFDSLIYLVCRLFISMISPSGYCVIRNKTSLSWKPYIADKKLPLNTFMKPCSLSNLRKKTVNINLKKLINLYMLLIA